jgi:hypothetical protein
MEWKKHKDWDASCSRIDKISNSIKEKYSVQNKCFICCERREYKEV